MQKTHRDTANLAGQICTPAGYDKGTRTSVAVGAAPVVRDEDCTASVVIRDSHVALRALKACSISDSRHQEGTYNEVYRGNYSARPVVSSA